MNNDALSPDLVRAYLQDIGRVPLLTPDQEISYGHQVQQLRSLLDTQAQLTQQLHRPPTDAEWATARDMTVPALHQALHQGHRAQQQMLSANLRLVVAIAKKYPKAHLELLDLIQEGTLGLQKAVEKFDPTRGYRFSTYAYWWIRQAITRALDEKSRTIRLPSHVCEKLNKIRRVKRQFLQQQQRTPTLIEVASVLKLEPEQLREYVIATQRPCSLEVRVGKDQESELQDLLPDHNHLAPEVFATQSALQDSLAQLLLELKPQHQAVLSLRFGLNDGQALTLAQVGQRLQLTPERVRQIERVALNKLRQSRNVISLKQYLH